MFTNIVHTITPTHPAQKIYWLLKNNGDSKYDPGPARGPAPTRLSN
jgi:hypothetical protein